MKFLFIFLLFCVVKSSWTLLTKTTNSYQCPYCQPEQVHIAFGEKTNDIVVTWSTFNNTEISVVEYGETGLEEQATGESTLFVDGGPLKREQYIHRVTLKDLKFNTKYVYHVGSVYGWSDMFWFKTPPKGEDWVVRAALYGDMGEKNAQSMSYLQEDVAHNKYDLILHVGDFAYNMDDDNALVGDQFMRQIEPLAAYVPYMVCVGNHEQRYNFSNYKNRFSMPGGTENMFYSWDLGPIHFIAISTEFYYYVNYGIKMVANQYDWVIEDLKKANLPENRAKRPWIILFGHRPMYCSNKDDAIDCSFEYTRKGIFGFFSLEPLLKDYGVDVVIWAHEHSYERTWPLYDNKVYNGSYEQPYVNPRAPVHVITGSAGCQEENDNFFPNPPPWSAFRTAHYGYTRFEAHNKTHIYMEQVDVNLKGDVIDQFWIVKEKHEPYQFD